MKFKHTSDENISNAKSLLVHLVEKYLPSCIKKMTDGSEVDVPENKDGKQNNDTTDG